MRGRVYALLLIPMLLSGCVAPPEALPEEASHLPDAPGTPEVPAQTALPGLVVRATDTRVHPLDTPRIRLDVTFDHPLDSPARLHTGWVSEDGASQGRTDEIPVNATSWNTTYEVTLVPGNHSLRLDAAWEPEASPAGSTKIRYTIWAPVRLVLNASEKYADDQNPFHTDHLVPFAPWDDESALHILRRAADTYGFTLKTHYRADFDSHFVDAINGTAFRWEVEAAGISRNWMILLDDQASRYAVDDTLPQPDQTLEFRYVRCYATGNCDDM